MQKKLVLFDFDGTITHKDSFIEFIKFYRGKWYFYLSCIPLAPSVILFKLKLISSQRLKEIFLSFFFTGEREDIFRQRSREFSLNVIPKMIRQKALERIILHQQNNDRVVVVSASMNEWLEPWCHKTGIECIATHMDYQDHLVNGKIAGLNCNGEEKVARIKEKIDLKDYSPIIAYGNSGGDEAMLKLADEGHYHLF